MLNGSSVADECGSILQARFIVISSFQFTKMSFSASYFDEVSAIIGRLDLSKIEELALGLSHLRERKGRLFILGVGGSAANASHAVNDFRKLCGFEAYAPTDNISELTARTNDEGWETVFVEWLKTSCLQNVDGLLVLSVGGGNIEKNVSLSLVRALEFAREKKASIFGIVGRDGGFTGGVADIAVVVPTINPATVTPHAEEFQAIVWHLLVSHPLLKINATKW
jgi:D-sedoheptulose 7-phosphate isomerase